ncbi:MAG: phosphatidylglycerophosphatase A family protein [Elusimicrobiales bacterium]
MEKIINFIASGFFISYLPVFIFKKKGRFKGCGFMGSLLAFVLYPYLIPERYAKRVIFIISFLLFSIWVSENAFSKEKEKDNPLIVIDEICGYFFGFFFIAKDIFNAVILFIFFRIFDTIKPFPIKRVEKIKMKGLAIVFDDIIAATYAGVIILALHLIKML